MSVEALLGDRPCGHVLKDVRRLKHMRTPKLGLNKAVKKKFRELTTGPNGSEWWAAIAKEFSSMDKHKVFTLVPKTPERLKRTVPPVWAFALKTGGKCKARDSLEGGEKGLRIARRARRLPSWATRSRLT